MKASEFRALTLAEMSEEQHAIRALQLLEASKFPQFERLIHVPNGGKRHIVTAKKMKAQGARSGVPDYLYFVGRGRYVGLALELKKIGGKPTYLQRGWLEFLQEQRWKCVVARGCEEMVEALWEYVKNG